MLANDTLTLQGTGITAGVQDLASGELEQIEGGAVLELVTMGLYAAGVTAAATAGVVVGAGLIGYGIYHLLN